jgi:hypothetical protein
VLRRLARSKNERVVLHALKLLVMLEKRNGGQRAPADDRFKEFYALLTDDQRRRMTDAIAVMRAVKREVYDAHGPDTLDEGTVQRFITEDRARENAAAAQQIAAPVQEPAAPPVAAPQTMDDAAEDDAAPAPYRVPPDLYESVGLFKLENGAVTHALGDAHAEAILRGDITLTDAKAAQRDLEQQLRRMPRKDN